MITLDKICHDMQIMHCNVKSWKKVGDVYGINKAMARLVAGGYKPGKKTRAKLGLPKVSSVIVLFGEAPNGTQSLGALLCPCGRWFIPNTGKRKRCFVCTPFRRRK